MKKGYIPLLDSVSEFQQIIATMQKIGIKESHIAMNQSFAEFSKTLCEGDVVVVYNLEFFTSVSELISMTLSLTERKIRIESLSEPWYNIMVREPSVAEGFNELSTRLRAKRSRLGLARAKAEGRTLGRPAGTSKLGNMILAVSVLRDKKHISIADACKEVGCNPRSYYRYMSKQRNK